MHAYYCPASYSTHVRQQLEPAGQVIEVRCSRFVPECMHACLPATMGDEYNVCTYDPKYAAG
jgi:hypothetical protein